MTENDLQVRAATCGTGVLLALVVVVAYLPMILLVVPVVILFLGMVADIEELHAAWYGILSTMGIFDPATLSNEEKKIYARNRHYFWFGEVASAAALAGAITVPLGTFLLEKTGSLLSFTIAAMLFLLLFVFLPKFIRQGMMTDTETILAIFGKNEQVKKVFWSVFVVLASFVLAQMLDPIAAERIAGVIAGVIREQTAWRC
jgi:hypothetical protein